MHPEVVRFITKFEEESLMTTFFVKMSSYFPDGFYCVFQQIKLSAGLSNVKSKFFMLLAIGGR